MITRLSIDVSPLSEGARRLLAEDSENFPCSSEVLPTNEQNAALPTTVNFSLRLPEDVVGSRHAEYGTSLFATGRAGLELARRKMALAGIGGEELDRLNTAQISFQSVVVPYLFKFATSNEASAWAAAMDRRARILGLDICYDISTNTVSYQAPLAGSVSPGTAVKSVGHPHGSGIVLRVLRWAAKKLIRIEVGLGSDYLANKGWSSLESWRNAYAEKRYEVLCEFRCKLDSDSSRSWTVLPRQAGH